MHVDIPDLRLLVNIVEAGSLTRGAHSIHLSPAAASVRLKTLEEQIGSRLFYRDNRGVTATPLGERLLRHARIILSQVEHAKNEVCEFTGREAGHIRIFAHTTAATELMPQVLAAFMGERPHVTIDLQERLSRDIMRGVLDGTTDLGLVAGPVPPADYQVIPFMTDRMVLVTPRGHPLADKPSVKLEEIASFEHIGLHESSSHTEFFREISNAHGAPLHVRIQMRSFDAMCRMIEAGVGIGFVPEGPARRFQRSMALELVEINEDWAFRERSVLVRDLEALPGYAKALVDHLLSFRQYQ